MAPAAAPAAAAALAPGELTAEQAAHFSSSSEDVVDTIINDLVASASAHGREYDLQTHSTLHEVDSLIDQMQSALSCFFIKADPGPARSRRQWLPDTEPAAPPHDEWSRGVVEPRPPKPPPPPPEDPEETKRKKFSQGRRGSIIKLRSAVNRVMAHSASDPLLRGTDWSSLATMSEGTNYSASAAHLGGVRGGQAPTKKKPPPPDPIGEAHRNAQRIAAKLKRDDELAARALAEVEERHKGKLFTYGPDGAPLLLQELSRHPPLRVEPFGGKVGDPGDAPRGSALHAVRKSLRPSASTPVLAAAAAHTAAAGGGGGGTDAAGRRLSATSSSAALSTARSGGKRGKKGEEAEKALAAARAALLPLIPRAKGLPVAFVAHETEQPPLRETIALEGGVGMTILNWGPNESGVVVERSHSPPPAGRYTRRDFAAVQAGRVEGDDVGVEEHPPEFFDSSTMEGRLAG
jgi:hypothetical protein